MTFETVINQNDETIALINAQDFQSAIESSMSALRCHQSLVQGKPSSIPLNSRDCLDQYIILDESNGPITQPSRRTFIYNRGIRIPRTSTDTTAIAAVLLFNTGLAHQLQAEKTPDPTLQAFLLQKARSMYALTYHVQKNCLENVLFLFAVRNNLAVIEQHTGKRAEIDHSLECLKCVNRIVDRGCQFRMAHMESFWRNLPSTADTAPSA